MPLFASLKSFYNDYEMPLARAFHAVDRRGILVDQDRLEAFKTKLDEGLEEACLKIENEVKLKVVPKQPKGAKTPEGTLNLSSPAQICKVIVEGLGIKLKKDRDSGKESTGEEALNDAYAATGNQVLKEILRVRELNKIKGTYAEATLVDSILYTSYNVAGTVTGRRSSRETPFTASSGHRIGTNMQNLPKQSKIGKEFRHCLVARPGKIFISCDQVQAEDFVVQALITDWGGGRKGLDELLSGADRHKRLASQIFNKPPDECGKGTMQRFLGKKTRHAGNYDMRAPRYAVVLSTEAPELVDEITKTGQKIINFCTLMLERFHGLEPEIRNTFQYGVERRIRDKRILETPIGRSRYFFGLRPGSDNSKIFKEAFSYIPQSTVGDNTGLAVLYCEKNEPGWVVMDTHDAVTLEVPNDEVSIIRAIRLLIAAFERKIIFENGLEIMIPIEFTMGYDLKNEMEFNHQCPDNSPIGWRATWHMLQQHQKVPYLSTSGPDLQPSQPH
jgi:hypothetical protein